MSENPIDNLLLKCLSGQADEHEYQEAYFWVHDNPTNFTYFNELREAWLAAGLINKHKYYDADEGWSRINSRKWYRFVKLPVKQVQANWSKVAAVFILALITGAMAYHFVFKQMVISGKYFEKQIVVEAPLGAKAVVVLSDSTRVWLNAGSRIQYSTGYDYDQRDVFLEGEAYFEIASNKRLPFRVHASDVVVEALGTSFNVKAYPEEDFVETTLVTGLARVERFTLAGEKEQVLLGPNQKATFAVVRTQAEAPFVAREVSPEIVTPEKIEIKASEPMESYSLAKYVNTRLYTSWKDKRFIFQREKMSDLAIKLERIYDVRINFKDEEIKSYHITGTLEQETLEQLLSVIRLTIPMDFEINKNQVTLSLNNRLKEKYEKLSN
jgi:transmembrane sensor